MNRRLDAAIEKLRVLPPSDRRRRDLADAHLFLGLSELALHERAAAKAALLEVVRLDPERRLDPEVYAPKVVPTSWVGSPCRLIESFGIQGTFPTVAET